MMKREEHHKEIRELTFRVCKFFGINPYDVESMLFRNWVERIQDFFNWETIIGSYGIQKKGQETMGKPKVKGSKKEEAEKKEATEGLNGDPLANIDFGGIANMELGNVDPNVSMEDLDSKAGGSLDGIDMSGLGDITPDAKPASKPKSKAKKKDAGPSNEEVLVQLDAVLTTLNDIESKLDATHKLVESIGKSEQFTTQNLIREMQKSFETTLGASLGALTKQIEEKKFEVTVEAVGEAPVEETPVEEAPKKAKAKAKAKPKAKAKAKKKKATAKKKDDGIDVKIKDNILAFVSSENNIGDYPSQPVIARIAGAMGEVTEQQVYDLLAEAGRIDTEKSTVRLGP